MHFYLDDSDTFETIGYLDASGCLRFWDADECKIWLVAHGWLVQKQEQFLFWIGIGRKLGDLANQVSPAVAAELLLRAGFRLPRVAYLALQAEYHEVDEPKKPQRTRRRVATQRPKGQYGLKSFVERKRPPEQSL